MSYGGSSVLLSGRFGAGDGNERPNAPPVSELGSEQVLVTSSWNKVPGAGKTTEAKIRQERQLLAMPLQAQP